MLEDSETVTAIYVQRAADGKYGAYVRIYANGLTRFEVLPTYSTLMMLLIRLSVRITDVIRARAFEKERLPYTPGEM